MPDPTALYPTPTRLALLRAVANAQVATDITADQLRIVLWPGAPTEWQTQETVTARVLELERAGWVQRTASGADWLLTDAGRQVLADA